MIVPVTGWGASDFDRFAAKLPEQIGHRRLAGQIDRKRFERFGDRLFRAVVDRRNPAAAEILQHHAFEQIVDVLHFELQIDVGVAGHFAVVFEESDARAEQGHFGQRQRSGGGRLVGFFGLRGRSVVGRAQTPAGTASSRSGVKTQTSRMGRGAQLRRHGQTPCAKRGDSAATGRLGRRRSARRWAIVALAAVRRPAGQVPRFAAAFQPTPVRIGRIAVSPARMADRNLPRRTPSPAFPEFVHQISWPVDRQRSEFGQSFCTFPSSRHSSQVRTNDSITFAKTTCSFFRCDGIQRA